MVNKMKKIIPVCIVAVLLFTSCQTKQSAISDLRALSQELRINGDNYSLADWKDAGERYYKINKRITKHSGEYSNAEVNEIAELNGECVSSFKDGAITKVMGAASAVKAFIEGLIK